MRKRIKSLTGKIFMEIMHSQNPVITVGYHAKTVNDINSKNGSRAPGQNDSIKISVQNPV